jgi:hypothetical protein
MLGAILLTESLIASNWIDFSDPVSLSWRFSTCAAWDESIRCDILCLGDSLVKHGLLPSVIERVSKRRAINLAAARCPTPMTYFLLRRALEAGAMPRAIVFDVKPAVLIGGLEWNLRYWQEICSLGEAIELFQLSGRTRFLVSVVAGRLLPSLRARLEVRSNVLAALRGQTDRLHDINRTLWRNWSVNSGANVTPPRSSYAGEVGSEVAERLHAGRFYCDRINAEAIHRLLKLAAARKIPVFWLLPPLAPALQAMRDEKGAEARYEEFLRSFQARYPGTVTFLDARRAGYPAELFVDATHLSSRGGAALSGSVAIAISDALKHRDASAGKYWVKLALPGLPATTLAPSLEDLDQSRTMVLGTGAPH